MTGYYACPKEALTFKGNLLHFGASPDREGQFSFHAHSKRILSPLQFSSLSFATPD